MASLYALQHAPDSPRLAAVLALVMLAQAFLPLPAHTRLTRDVDNGWILICTLATPAGGDQAPSDKPAPGILFAQLTAELLGFAAVTAVATTWRQANPEPASAPRGAVAPPTFPTLIRAPPAVW